MKGRIILFLGFAGVISMCSGQQNTYWEKWNWLIGEWKGEGSGNPGQGSGTFSFSFDLDQKVLIRKNHSEYPATESQSRIIHDDLMIVYSDDNMTPSKAIYFDNEGHTINYSITFPEQTVVFLSDTVKGGPVFRLTYTLIESHTIGIKFEMSQDGEKYITYLDGKCEKIQ